MIEQGRVDLGRIDWADLEGKLTEVGQGRVDLGGELTEVWAGFPCSYE